MLTAQTHSPLDFNRIADVKSLNLAVTDFLLETQCQRQSHGLYEDLKVIWKFFFRQGLSVEMTFLEKSAVSVRVTRSDI